MKTPVTISRAEFLKIVIDESGGLSSAHQSPKTSSFLDVQTTHSCFDFIEAAVQREIVSGDTDQSGVPIGRFRPDEPVNQAEAAKILTLAFKMSPPSTSHRQFPDVPEDAWFHQYVVTVVGRSIMDVDNEGRFNPAALVTPQQVKGMIARARRL